MTPAEAQKVVEEVRVKRPSQARLRIVGSVDSPDSDGPGAKLQNARLNLGLSVVQVAQALKLRPDQVAAMESMHFAKLPGLGYGLGYVRAYAELVDLDDVKAVVEDFKEAWGPQQKHNEDVRAKSFDGRIVLPFGFALLLGLIIWAIVGFVSQNIVTKSPEEVKSPDAAIKAWVEKAPQEKGNSIIAIDPLYTIHAARNVRVVLRGQDGALVADKNLKSGEILPADGLGRFIISTNDAGALSVHGFGQVVVVGGNGERVDWWRVPDLDLMARQASEAKAAEEALKNQKTDASIK